MLIRKIKKKDEFSLIFNSGKFLKLNNMIIQYFKNPKCTKENRIRYGVIASKKVGPAVKRNFAKRRLRSLSHIIKTYGQNNYDYVLVAKKSFVNTSFKSLLYELKSGLTKIKKI